MKIHCPECKTPFRRTNKHPKTVIKSGCFYRRSDRKQVQRFFCRGCGLHFSVATLSACYRQKKRQLNGLIFKELVSLVSQRECHRKLKINLKTVVRKYRFMAPLAQQKLERLNARRTAASEIEFDDLETFEHTKLKPLSVTLAVESGSRWILGYEVSVMPANGLLAAASRKKYGPRPDMRKAARQKLFVRIRNYIKSGALIKSDQNPHYVEDVRRFFPESLHMRYKGRKGCIVGQGELKKIGFDPLFSLNHTCAALRARTNRLIRKTWCTTKKRERLSDHLALVVLRHNLGLKRRVETAI